MRYSRLAIFPTAAADLAPWFQGNGCVHRALAVKLSLDDAVIKFFHLCGRHCRSVLSYHNDTAGVPVQAVQRAESILLAFFLAIIGYTVQKAVPIVAW